MKLFSIKESAILTAYLLNADSNDKTSQFMSARLCFFCSCLLVRDEKKDVSRPKKKLLAADIKKMHNILSKNTYKIRHRVTIMFTISN